jgi:DNA-binding NarL/FixJ family response regulator
VHGYLSKTLPARDLVAAIEAVHAGQVAVSDAPPRSAAALGLDWPGRREGISDREAEILALITQGRSNAEIARITYLSPNTVKTYIRSVYRKIGVTSRTQAVLWGVRHGFSPDHHRIDHWIPSDPT